MPARPFPTSADPLAAAIALAPRIRDSAAETEANRRVSMPIIDAMRDEGIFHMAVARDVGGIESDPLTLCRVIEEISAADGSAGWCVMIASQNAIFGGFLDPAVARTVWGNRHIVAGTARPIGRAVVQPDGSYRVSGRWPFASGSTHADYFAAECLVYDGEAPRRDESGNPISAFALVPRANVQVHDTWHTTGLRGSASNDFSITDAAVSAEFGARIYMDRPQHPWPLYRGLSLIGATHGAQALGVARSALAELVALAQVKLAWGDRPLREQTRLQAQVAEATVLIEAARHYLWDTVAETWAILQAGGEPGELLRARGRLAASHAATCSVRAVDIVHRAAATTAVMISSPIERCFRDLHTADAHVMVSALIYEAAGRVELGLPANMPFF